MNGLNSFPDFEEIPHKADVAIIAYGYSLPELFTHAALGLYHILGPTIDGQLEAEEIFEIQAHDIESMLVSFLTELLFLAEKGIKTEILELVIDDNALNVKYLKKTGQIFLNSIKAVTFNEMKILKKGEIFQTRIVFDL